MKAASIQDMSVRWEWDDTRYYLALARNGTLSSAARALGVEHSTVARRIDGFERALGVVLFRRSARGWSLSASGQSLLAHAQRLEAEFEAFGRAALGASEFAGRVVLTAPPAVVTHWIVPQLTSLLEQHPGIELELRAERRAVDLDHGEADLALRVGMLEATPGLVVRRIGTVGYGLYGLPSETQARAPRFLGFDQSMAGSAQKQWLDHLARGHQVVLRSNDLAALHLAAVSGRGLALLPHFMVRPADGLVLASTAESFERPLSLLMHADMRRVARVKAVADFCYELGRSQSKRLKFGDLEPKGKPRWGARRAQPKQ